MLAELIESRALSSFGIMKIIIRCRSVYKIDLGLPSLIILTKQLTRSRDHPAGEDHSTMRNY